jgi:hypothetical protein
MYESYTESNHQTGRMMPLTIPSGAPTLFIRRTAYERSGLSRATIDERLGLTADEFRVEGALIAIGPITTEESLVDIIGELEGSGLTYFEDFFELTGNWPDWLKILCSATDVNVSR